MTFDEKRDRTRDEGCCVICDRCTWFAHAGQFYKKEDKMLCLEHYLKLKALFIGSRTKPESLEPLINNLRKQYKSGEKPDKKPKKSKSKIKPLKVK